MKKLIFIISLFTALHSEAQTPSGSKVRYQGSWYLCKDTATLTINDTASITYQCKDSSLYFKSLGYWRKIATINPGGTSSQFLKADGSVDANAYLPLSGGILTGNITANNFYLPTYNTLNSISPYVFSQSGNTDYFNINLVNAGTNQSELVFTVGDDGTPFSNLGERFRFHYDGASLSKDPLIIDYDTSYFYNNIKVGASIIAPLTAGSSTDSIVTKDVNNIFHYRNITSVSPATNLGSSFSGLGRTVNLTSSTGTGTSFTLPHDSLNYAGGANISILNSNTITLTNIPNSSLQSSTISGISLGSNLNTLTFGTDLSGTSYNGSAAVTINNTSTLSSVTGRGNSTSTGISLTQNGNTSTSYAIYGKRNTDISPAGYFMQFQNTAANTNLFLVDINGNLTASSLIRAGGTTSQFLKADGSVDANAYLPLSAPLTANKIPFANASSLLVTSINLTYDSVNQIFQNFGQARFIGTPTYVVPVNPTAFFAKSATNTSASDAIVINNSTDNLIFKVSGNGQTVFTNTIFCPSVTNPNLYGSFYFLDNNTGNPLIEFKDNIGSFIVGDRSYNMPDVILGASSILRGFLPPKMDSIHRNSMKYVVSITVTAGGSGYTSAPSVTVSGGTPVNSGSNTAPSAHAIIISGAVTSVVIDQAYSLYTSAPTVSFSGGGGTGASANAVLGNTKGNIIYCTDCLSLDGSAGVLQVYDGSVWKSNLTTSAAASTYLPLTGGTLTGALTGTSATFSSTISINNAILTYPLSVKGVNVIADFQSTAASSLIYFTPSSQDQYRIGTGIAIVNDFGIQNVTRTANYLLFSGGPSGGQATFLSSVTATSFIKSGGTSSQFLKADGSVDGTAYLPLTGGTLSGTLNGTSVILSNTSNIVAAGLNNISSIATLTDVGTALNAGAAISANSGELDYTATASRTIPQSNIVSGGLFVNRPNISGSSTITITQGAAGKRAMSGITGVFSIPSAAASTSSISDAAGLRSFLYADNTANLYTITNYYGLLLGNSSEYMPTNITNRYGIYQEGANDINYFAGNILGKSGLSLKYTLQTATYSILTTDYTIDCNGTFTVTLPTAAGVSGQIYVIKNSGTGTITIACTSTQTIDGNTTKTLSTQYGSLMVQSNGTNWLIIN